MAVAGPAGATPDDTGADAAAAPQEPALAARERGPESPAQGERGRGASSASPVPASAPRDSRESRDPRVRRTREVLQRALLRLLKLRDFETLSVQEITESAGLNRATFYAHYPDKFALLECVVASRFEALLASRGVVFDGTCAAALRAIALGVCDYLAEVLDPPAADPAQSEPPRPRDRQLAPHLEASIAAVVRQMLLDGLKQHSAPRGPSPEMLAATAAWAVYGAAREWVSTPDRKPSEEFAGEVQRLVAPLLGMALAPVRPQEAHVEQQTASILPA